jgi:hypothetical protein
MTEHHVLGGIEAAAHAARALTELDHVVEMMKGMEVRAADAAGKRPDQSLAGARDGRLDLIADQLASPPYNRPHDALPFLFVGAIMRVDRSDASVT